MEMGPVCPLWDWKKLAYLRRGARGQIKEWTWKYES
jgi:hypothetical protein